VFGGYEKGMMSSMYRGEEQMIFIAKLTRAAEVEKGAPEQQTAT
jgi:hypothetical protein